MIDTRKGGWKENDTKGNGKRRTLMKKTFGKILGAGLCLGMVLGLMPTQALQVKAADEHKHCVCGATHRDVGDHTSETEIMFQAWKKTDSLPDTAAHRRSRGSR